MTKLPDNTSGLIWNTYNAHDEVNNILSNKKPSAVKETQPLTLVSPITGEVFNMAEMAPPNVTQVRTPNNEEELQTSGSHTKLFSISQLLTSSGARNADASATDGELSSPQLTESLEMGTQWAQPALMETLPNGDAKSTPAAGLSWSYEGVSPTNEIPETKTPREQVELDMLSSSQLERTAGKPKSDDYDEMDVAQSVKMGQNPQPLIRAIRDELVRLQRKETPVSEL